MDDLPFEVYLTKGQSGLGMSLSGGDSAGMQTVSVVAREVKSLHVF